MTDSISSPGIDLPSPTLSARLRELADYLSAPAVGRLTEEQRALTLGIARRLVADAACRLDSAIDPAALWRDWLREGIPAAARIAAVCFARAEEHRWRQQSARRSGLPAVSTDAADTAEIADPAAQNAPSSEADRAYLALRIADRRRFDAQGNPCLALADLDTDILRSLLFDIAAWRLAQVTRDSGHSAALGGAMRAALDGVPRHQGVDRAASVYHAILGSALRDEAATAIARHDWPIFIALAAAASGRSYDAMALQLLTAECAALPSLLAALQLDRSALAPLEASLAMLPARATGGGAAGDGAR